MTAVATIQSSDRGNSLLVPNTALRFTPSTAAAPVAASGGTSIVSRLVMRPPGAGGTRRAAGVAAGGNGGGTKQLWVLRDGQPLPVTVTAGASDGRRTEVSGSGLAEGDAVITDQRSGAVKS
jgi:HlyD family secretion protein